MLPSHGTCVAQAPRSGLTATCLWLVGCCTSPQAGSLCYSCLPPFQGLHSRTQGIPSNGMHSMKIWPGLAPSETEANEGEVLPEEGCDCQRITNVSCPTVAVYPGEATAQPAPAVLVCPGGGYDVLAYDKEGTEFAQWLNSIGYAAVILKYRVPAKKDGALQDAQRAMRLVRRNATAWGVDPGHVGVLGFSAGAHLSARLSTAFETATYSAVDDTDQLSCRPDFSVLAYPAYMAGQDCQLAPEFAVTAHTPPAFMVHTADDPYPATSSIAYYLALWKAGVRAEMHVFPAGGHGYGLRPSEHAVTRWPELCAVWLRNITS